MSSAPISNPPAPERPAAAPSPPPSLPSFADLTKNLLAQVQKPGYATTEFWTTAFFQISSIGIAVGLQFFHWNDEQVKDWSRITGELVPALALVASFLVTRQYVNQRGDFKKIVTTLFGGIQGLGGQPADSFQPNASATNASPTPLAGWSGELTVPGGRTMNVDKGKIMSVTMMP